jgi:predicted nicotinamide N-methyase
MPHSPVGYFTKQENIAVAGVADMVIRSLLDKQQFHDPLEAALRLGISSATWPLFGLLWPSGARLAERLATRPVRLGERILEIGCGLALSSLVGHRRGADVTASDCHPLAGAFLAENVRLNGLLPIKYRHGQWGRLPDEGDFASPPPMSDTLQPAPARAISGRFDLIIGSDILYERDEAGALADFINQHAAPQAEIWVVDPNRGNRAQFRRHMSALGFTLSEQPLARSASPGVAAYNGRMLSYLRLGGARQVAPLEGLS